MKTESDNVKIAELAKEIGARYLSVLHHSPDGAINQMARRDLKVFARELLELLADTPDVLEGERRP